MKINISKESQLGKAGEHLVCADLILRGFNAFIVGEGLYYDILVDVNGSLKKIQVKTISKIRDYRGQKNLYRFGTRRRSRRINNSDRLRTADVDFYAFVALDIKQIAYVPISNLLNSKQQVYQSVDFKDKNIKYEGRTYSTGKNIIRGKYLQDFSNFAEQTLKEVSIENT